MLIEKLTTSNEAKSSNLWGHDTQKSWVTIKLHSTDFYPVLLEPTDSNLRPWSDSTEVSDSPLTMALAW